MKNSFAVNISKLFKDSFFDCLVYFLNVRIFMLQAFAKEREMSSLKVGDKVYAKHKNTRYYKATLVKIKKQTFCCLDFDDGSFSDDTFPEDIVVCISQYMYIIEI